MQDQAFKYCPPQCLTADLVRLFVLEAILRCGIMFVADDTTYLLLHSVRLVRLQEAGHGSWACHARLGPSLPERYGR